MASPSGCSEPRSSEAASRRTVASSAPFAAGGGLHGKLDTDDAGRAVHVLDVNTHGRGAGIKALTG
jgi:hypothetical protein